MKKSYVLKVTGHRSSVFKTKHQNSEYLENLASGLLSQRKSPYTDFTIYKTNNCHHELTTA